MTSKMFVDLVDRAKNGTPPGRGWGVYEISCPRCGFREVAIALIGSKGYECPSCNYTNERFWLDNLPVQAGDTSHLLPVGWMYARHSSN